MEAEQFTVATGGLEGVAGLIGAVAIAVLVVFLLGQLMQKLNHQ